MLKAIIIDDESAAIRSLELLLQAYCPNVSVLAKGQSVKEGIDLLLVHNPDIVFLDIEMPHGNGFELIEQAPDLNFEIIFVTAYNQYAIKAFKYSAIDYLLKPIEPDELVLAVEKVENIRKTKISPRERYAILFENIKEIIPRKLVVPYNNSFKYIDLTSVLFIHERDNTLTFVTNDCEPIEIDKGLIDAEEMLYPRGFLSLNNGTIINLNKVCKIDKMGKGKVTLEGGHVIELVSFSKDILIEKLTLFNNNKQ